MKEPGNEVDSGFRFGNKDKQSDLIANYLLVVNAYYSQSLSAVKPLQSLDLFSPQFKRASSKPVNLFTPELKKYILPTF